MLGVLRGLAAKIPALKKYWHVIGIGIQSNLTYRINYLTRTLFSFIPLFAMLSLWRTIYARTAPAICSPATRRRR